MSGEQREPARWLDGDELTDDVRRELALYAADAPSLGSRARMLAGLEQELGLAGPEAGASAAKKAVAGKLKIVGGSLLLLAGAMGLLAWLSLRDKPVPPAPAVVVAPVAVEPAPLRAQAEVALAPAEEPPLAEAAPSRPKRARRAQLASRAPTSRLPDAPAAQLRADPVAELALLGQARRALLNEPAHALEFTEVHARDYPRGTFAEEREVLAIEALYRLQLSEEARKRTRSFEQHFPNSAQRAHLTRMMQTLGP